MGCDSDSQLRDGGDWKKKNSRDRYLGAAKYPMISDVTRLVNRYMGTDHREY